MKGQIGQKIERARQLGIRLGVLKAIGYEAEFTYAYRRKNMPTGLVEDTKSEFTVYDRLDDYWYADPLIYCYKGKEYVFMEAYERRTDLGRIAVAEVSDVGLGEPEVIMAEEFHLSFPVLFEINKKIYMIPETSTADQVILYECENFPKVWKKSTEFFKGRQVVDIVPVCRKNNEIIFVGSECMKNSLQVRFFAFSIAFGAKLTAKEEKDYNALQKYDYRSRNGGYMVGGMFVLQESTQGIYGRNLQFATSSQSLPQELKIYKKIEPRNIRLKKGKIKHIIGTHTYSCTEHYELIDVQYMRFNSKKWINRYRNSKKNEKETPN